MERKLCIDCRHATPGRDGTMTFARCAKYPDELSTVTGLPKGDHYAETYRLAGQPCGPDAALFEPKVPA